ncbi:HAD domain-containing protein [Nonomuraea roseoviolacea subsp. roseoviolacea]|uniref:HAD domain-containing protein n=1 Tax=Nonomuraea roseoviolacea TaxID=103837 RepID=UPI0031DF3E3A
MSPTDSPAGSADRPLLFLDVDGTLLPFGTPPDAAAPRPAVPLPPGSNPLLSRIDPRHGPRLAALPCDLVWATTWMGEANEVISPLLGLPALPVVDWPDPSGQEGPLHWKTPGLVGWAAGRPFVWVDDEITGADRAWVAAHHRGRALPHRVDPRRGLTEADVAVIAGWLAEL